MTQPTIEHVLEEIRRLPVRCEIQKLDNSPSDEFLRGWALGIAMASKTAKDECSKLSQLVAALTAQAGDGNRLPLEEVPEGWRLAGMRQSPLDEPLMYFVSLCKGVKTASGHSPLPAEALRAAIAAAKDGAG